MIGNNDIKENARNAATGQVIDWGKVGEADTDRFEVFAGGSWYHSISEQLDVFLSARVGFANTAMHYKIVTDKNLESDPAKPGNWVKPSQTSDDSDMSVFGGVSVGVAYAFSDSMRLRLGVEYNTYLLSVHNNAFDDVPFSKNIVGTVGLEFKF